MEENKGLEKEEKLVFFFCCQKCCCFFFSLSLSLSPERKEEEDEKKTPLTERHHGVQPPGSQPHPFLARHRQHPLPDVRVRQRREPEPRAPGLQRRDDLRGVVGDQAEARVAGVLFYDAAQSKLRVLGHRVALVQDHQLELVGEDRPRRREVDDLLPDDADASVVRGVELEDHRGHGGRAVEGAGDCEDGGGLARSWGAVEEEVREAVLGDEAAD